MKSLETGKDKIQKICDSLRKETLDPAKQEAREIIENAHLQAAEIIGDAKKRAEERLSQVEQEIEEKKKVFQSSLQLASRQGIERLRQSIELELFNKELVHLIDGEIANPKAIAEILEAFIRTMEEKGIEEDFAATIPKKISPRSISALLAQKVLDRLEKEIFSLGDFSGGVKISLKGRKITIDITDTVVRELIGQYIRRDFRSLIFNV